MAAFSVVKLGFILYIFLDYIFLLLLLLLYNYRICFHSKLFTIHYFFLNKKIHYQDHHVWIACVLLLEHT